MGGRNDFTESEDAHLVEYIATYKPEPAGRLGNNLYIALEENEGNKWPWSKYHSWQSWRERYKKNQYWFDRKIRIYQKQKAKGSEDVTEKKVAKKTEKAPTSKPEGAGSVKQKKPRAEAPPKDEVVKIQRDAAQRSEKQVETGSRNVFASRPASVSEPMSRAVQGTQEVQGETVGKPVDPDDYMHELFGSSAEEDNVEDFQKPQNPPQPNSPPQNIYPNLADAPAPTLGTTEPHVPGAFDVVVQQLSQEPTPPKSGPEDSIIEKSAPLLVRPRPTKKLKKRMPEVDPFETPPSTPPLPSHPTLTKGKPPTLVEGPFRNSLKRPRAAEDAAESAWPPKRMKTTGESNHIQDAKLSEKLSVFKPGLPPLKPPTRPQQPQQVNAVASSSRVKLPGVRPIDVDQPTLIHSALGRDDSAPSSVWPETRPLTNPTGHNAQVQSKTVQNAKALRNVNELPTKHHPEPRQVFEKALPTLSSKSNKIHVLTPEANIPSRPSVVPNLLATVSRTDSNVTLPSRPTSDNDPFTSEQISGNVVGKASAVPYLLENKPPRRIDLHRQSLSKRPRASTSFPSRPSSVVSTRTSTSSDSKKIKKSSRSTSLRRSIAELNLADDGKQFAVAAAEEMVQVMDAMAKQHGVSTEIAIKTYMTTRNMEKTKIVLAHLFQGLSELEREIYSRMPTLRYTSDAEDDLEDEDEIPAGLIPRRDSGKMDEGHHSSPQRKQDSASPRRSRPSLTVKPLPLDETLSDYSPPNSSRAGQFVRLVRQGRKEEALEREQRRASGAFVPQTQVQQPRPTGPPEDISPTPRGREVAMEVDQEEDDDDMYMRTDDERHEADDEAEQPEEKEEDSALLYHSRTLSRRISEGEEQEPALARKHRALALGVDAENAGAMREFEAANDPDFLRFMSIKWVTEILEAQVKDHEMEEELGVEEPLNK